MSVGTNTKMSSTEKPEQDEVEFANGARGRFFRPGAVSIPPVHLEPDVLAGMRARAKEMGVGIDELVNEQLRKALESA